MTKSVSRAHFSMRGSRFSRFERGMKHRKPPPRVETRLLHGIGTAYKFFRTMQRGRERERASKTLARESALSYTRCKNVNEKEMVDEKKKH